MSHMRIELILEVTVLTRRGQGLVIGGVLGIVREGICNFLLQIDYPSTELIGRRLLLEGNALALGLLVIFTNFLAIIRPPIRSGATPNRIPGRTFQANLADPHRVSATYRATTVLA